MQTASLSKSKSTSNLSCSDCTLLPDCADPYCIWQPDHHATTLSGVTSCFGPSLSFYSFYGSLDSSDYIYWEPIFTYCSSSQSSYSSSSSFRAGGSSKTCRYLSRCTERFHIATISVLLHQKLFRNLLSLGDKSDEYQHSRRQNRSSRRQN